MKKYVMIMGLLLSFVANSQTVKEVFQQKKTQREYLLKQIAMLQMYAGYTAKGYQTVQKGLNVVERIKDGEYKLHDLFFAALSKVNPKIGSYSKVGEAIRLQIAIVRVLDRLKTWEEPTVVLFARNLRQLSWAQVDELMMVTTDDAIQMSDAQRIKRIDKVYAEMQSIYAAAKRYTDELKIYQHQKKGNE